jgi:anti-sigma B factor antagonist
MSSLKAERKKTEDEHDVLVVYFTDAKILDEARIQQIGKELMDKAGEAETTDSKNMLVNFQGVQFMSSAMIGKLVLLNKKAKSANLNLKFCSISPNVLEVFKITRLNKVFDIKTDEDSGLKAFGKKGWFG